MLQVYFTFGRDVRIDQVEQMVGKLEQWDKEFEMFNENLEMGLAVACGWTPQSSGGSIFDER